MKVVILAGGMGTRISEESRLRPKPMIEIGEKPVMWHIMKWYASFGYTEFVICCGYKGHMIKDYFLNYYLHQGSVSIDLQTEHMKVLQPAEEAWKVTLADTGLYTKTAGRILNIKKYLDNEAFMLTYGDGVADIDIDNLLKFHRSMGRVATITTTQPEGRFGVIKMSEAGMIEEFKEKARRDQSWVNAGFMVMEPGIFDYLGDGSQMLEDQPFERLASDGEMAAYRHSGFWSPMDSMRDKAYLDDLWNRNMAPWKVIK